MSTQEELAAKRDALIEKKLQDFLRHFAVNLDNDQRRYALSVMNAQLEREARRRSEYEEAKAEQQDLQEDVLEECGEHELP